MTAMDPVFNEPSAAPAAADRQAARNRMIGVVGVLIRMPNHGLGRSLRISECFYQLPLAPDYTMTDWLIDREVGRDHLNFFLGLAAKAPYLRQTDANALERIEDTEVTCHGQSHPAFLAAHLLDAPLVSFDHDAWAEPVLPVNVIRLDGEGDLCEESDTLVNFSNCDHFAHHARWFARRDAIEDARDLWCRCAELFPHLTFCPSVEDQLKEQETILPKIIDRLREMERIAATGRPFGKDAFQYKCHPTSAPTFGQFSLAYEFTTPDGTSKRCGWHFYLPDGRRIYFSPDFTIGHIGGHLPTVKFH